jgi:prepilin peptidase CpaA
MPATIYIFIFIQLLAVSIGDIFTKKIPNAYSILNIFLFFVFLFIFRQHYTPSLQLLLYSFIFLFVGFGLFLLRIMGGGDSKYLFSLFLLIPKTVQDIAFYYLLLSTIMIGTSFLLMNVVKNFAKIKAALQARNFLELKNCFGTKFSFAPVIFVAWGLVGWKIGMFKKIF